MSKLVEDLPALPIREPDKHCNARVRNRRGYCKRPAGWGTDHRGLGRCSYHGGSTPIRTGAHSKVRNERLRDLLEHYAADPDPLNIVREVHMLRALAVDFVNRASDSKVGDAGNLVIAGELVERTTRVVERIERIRQNKDALPRSEVLRIVSELAKAVDLHVNDDTVSLGAEAVKERIRNAWDAVRL